MDRLVAVLVQRAPHAEHGKGRGRADKGRRHRQRRNARNPDHGGGGIADHAARAPRIGRRHDRRQEADAHPPAIGMARHHSAHHRARDIVQEDRQHKNQRQQDQPPQPAARQKARNRLRRIGKFELVGQYRKAQQQQEQIGQQHPSMGEMRTHQRSAARPRQLESQDNRKPGQRHPQRLAVRQRHTGQCQAEQIKFQRNTKKIHVHASILSRAAHRSHQSLRKTAPQASKTGRGGATSRLGFSF